MSSFDHAHDRATGGAGRGNAATQPDHLALAVEPAHEESGVTWWLFDDIDVSVLWLGADGVVLRANRAAIESLRDHPTLELHAGRLTARRAPDRHQLRQGMARAFQRDGPDLVRLGSSGDGGQLALQALATRGGPTTWVCLLQRQRPASRLAVEQFARACALTPAESQVLWLLGGGRRPREIAESQGVATSAACAQIRALRERTGCTAIRALIETLGRLPPVRGLPQGAADAGDACRPARAAAATTPTRGLPSGLAVT